MNELLVVPVLLIMWAHIIGDFLVQVPYHTYNKGDNPIGQLNHVGVYSLPFIVVAAFIPINPIWLIVNLLLHGVTDFFTTKQMSHYWHTKNYTKFFMMIGLDQLIHFATLLFSYPLITSNPLLIL